MFAEKPKRKENVFQDELLEREEILWMGQGDKWRLFNGQDLFLIPFSLFWCSIAIPMLISGFVTGNIIFILMPHGWIGLYMLFGRFIVKYLRKENTYYAVTNERVLILSHLFGRRLQAFSVHHLPTLEKRIGMGGVGTITFAELPPKSWWKRNQSHYSNTGLEMFGQVLPGFYDIHEVDEVYRMIAQMAHQTSYAPVEKAKPSYLPR